MMHKSVPDAHGTSGTLYARHRFTVWADLYVYIRTKKRKSEKKNVKVVERDRRWSEPYTPPQLLDVDYKVVYERPMTLGQ